MGDLLIRNIPEALKRDLESMARRDGKSLSSKSIELLQRSLLVEPDAAGKPFVSAWDVLRPIFEQDGPPDGEFAKIMDEIEADRKRDFGRPVDFGLDGYAVDDDRS